MNIASIRAAIQANRIRVTDHADEEAVADRLAFEEIIRSVLEGEVIEDYSTSKPYPSCLILWSDVRWRARAYCVGV